VSEEQTILSRRNSALW